MPAQLDTIYIKTRPTKTISRLISYLLFEGRPLTTKGRWINPLLFGLFAIEKRLPQLKKVEKPIFILGTGRSGTTILSKILSLHKDIGFLNEPKALWHSIFKYEDLIGNYSLDTAYYRLDEKKVNEKIILYAHRLYGAYLCATCSKRVLDKYPEMIFRVPFLKTIFPDSKFLLLIRNGRDTCSSIEKWSKSHKITSKNELHNWWGNNNRKWNLLVEQIVSEDPDFKKNISIIRNLHKQMDMAAVEWIVTVREGLNLISEYHDQIHVIRFEDLVSNPKKTLSDILNYCELPKDEKVYKYAAKALTQPLTGEKSLNLHHVIRPVFDQTMQSIGY